MCFFEKLTVEGIDISKFSIYSADKKSVDHRIIKSAEFAVKLSELFEEKLIGCSLPLAEEMLSGNYIVISASGLDADEYSVKIRDGNIYIEGSFLSIDTAYNAFVTKILGYSEEKQGPKFLNLTSDDDIEGSLHFSVPYTKQDLIELFGEAAKKKNMVLSGTHAYKGNGNKGWIASTSEAVFELSGKHPAIMEIDVGRHSVVYFDFYSKGNTITPYDLSAFVSESAEHVANGGIVSVCVHMSNPLNNAADKVWYRGTLGSDDVARDMLTEGTELNRALRKTLESTFMLIKALDDNGIPFMFRPLHEMNGGWFWWCIKQSGGALLSEQTMKDFWKFFYNIVTKELGIKNALWVYSPNYNTGWCADVLYAYPGDEYVDIVGCDWYTSGNYEVNNEQSYRKVMSTGKPAALTEVGPASGGALAKKNEEGKIVGYDWTCADLLATIKRMLDDGFDIAYFLTWTGKGSIAGLGETDIIMNDEIIVTREDLLARFTGKN